MSGMRTTKWFSSPEQVSGGTIVLFEGILSSLSFLLRPLDVNNHLRRRCLRSFRKLLPIGDTLGARELNTRIAPIYID